MLSPKILNLLNAQIAKELQSAYIYMGIANYYNNEGLEGFENWFTVQAQEERDHALLIRTYIMDNDEKVELLAIDAASGDYADFGSPIKTALEHEKYITASINTIYGEAYSQKDYRTMQFLDWFIKEQMEEEKNASDLIQKYELFGQDCHSVFLMDQELGARVYAAVTMQA